MDRRQFFRMAMLGAAVLAVDPEQLLWTPKKTIFIPSGPTGPVVEQLGKYGYWYAHGTDAEPAQTFVVNCDGRIFVQEFHLDLEKLGITI